MLEWLFGRKPQVPRPSSSGAHVPQALKVPDNAQSRLAGLPVDTRQLVAGLGARLQAMVLTDPVAAAEELEGSNASRRQMWGTQAVDVPIQRGQEAAVVASLIECLAADHNTGSVTRVAVEEVPAPVGAEVERVERAREQLEDKSPVLRARYEKRFIKHMRKAGQGSTAASAAIRKIVVTVYFQNTFGRHQFLRVAGSEYYFMPCSKR